MTPKIDENYSQIWWYWRALQFGWESVRLIIKELNLLLSAEMMLTMKMMLNNGDSDGPIKSSHIFNLFTLLTFNWSISAKEKPQNFEDNDVIGCFCCLFMLMSLYWSAPLPQPLRLVAVVINIEFRNHLETQTHWVRWSTTPYSIGTVITFHLSYII